jgi:Flp pilus assembly protein TadD
MPKESSNLRKNPARMDMQDLDFEISFMEGVARRDPNFVEALQILGDDYTRRGRLQDGLKVDERLAGLQPDDALVHYNLACSCALTGQIERAVRELETAMDLGYRDFVWMSRDPDLKALRSDPLYQRVRAKVRLLKDKTP